jgi:site-specific DNA recombinase
MAKVFKAITIGVREARAKRLNVTRRHVFLLSGLLRCGYCQGRYEIIPNIAMAASTTIGGGSCSNHRTIQRALIEQRVIAELTERLVSAEAWPRPCALTTRH